VTEQKRINMTTKKIALVDDDETVRKTFALLLGKKYRVETFKDPKQALAKINGSQPDLLIADFKLPQFSGVELIRKLREKGYVGEAMLITAHPDDVRLADMSRFNISHFFVKPLDLDVLNASIDRVLQPKDPPPAAA
jgi:DNA-binding NtrC family response regulator